MIFLGETEKEWHACNFFDKNEIYKFPKKGYEFPMKTLCRFNIRRLSKYFKHTYRIKDVVLIDLQYALTAQPLALCEILQLKLKYDWHSKKCYPGYRFHLINQKDYNPAVNRVKNALDYSKERYIKKYINYNKFWNYIYG